MAPKNVKVKFPHDNNPKTVVDARAQVPDHLDA